MSAIASQIAGVSIVVIAQPFVLEPIKENQSSVALAFVKGIHLWLVDFPHKRPVRRNMFPFDDIIMLC